MFTASVSILLLLINFSSGLREEFYLTYEAANTAPDSPTRCAASISRFDKGVRCCLDSDNDGSVDICTSKDSNNNCLSDTTTQGVNGLTTDYETAKQLCLNRGAGYRLCTITELSSPVCTNTDCYNNKYEVWSSEGCNPIYKTRRLNPADTETQDGITTTASVRCCEAKSSNNDCFSSTGGVCYYELAGFTETTQDQISFTEATQICENDNKRICSLSRYNNVCPGTGCSASGYYVWTRDMDSFSPTTWSPSFSPTAAPSVAPTTAPTFAPTFSPSNAPSDVPTDNPTFVPTDGPTDDPTNSPTFAPTYGPVETPVVPWGQFEADRNVSNTTAGTWDNVFRLNAKLFGAFPVPMEIGIDVRPDANGELAFLFAKAGVYKVEFRVATVRTCIQKIELRPAEDFSLNWVGQSSFVQSSTDTVSVSFIALITDTSQLYVIYSQPESLYDAEDCYPSDYRYDSVITWIYDV